MLPIKLLPFFLCTLLISCSNKQEKKDEVYYIIKHPERVKRKDTFNLPRPPEIFYGNFNFILVDSLRAFYFSSNNFFASCIKTVQDSKPQRLNLTPNEIIEIKTSELPEFLKKLPIDSIKKYDRYSTGSISSAQDTIKNRAFKIINEYFLTHGVKYFAIRNLTEEEQYVSEAKIQNKIYDPDKIEWKIGFNELPVKPIPNKTEKK